MNSLFKKIAAAIGFGFLALVMSMLAGGVWAGLMLANMKTTPPLPWALVIMAALLWLAWRYLGGKGWPRSTSAARRQYLRANPVSAQVFFWTLLTGVLAIISLAGLWIVLFQLVKMPPNALSDYSRYPLFTVAGFILMGSLVSPLMEERSGRGGGIVILLCSWAREPRHSAAQAHRLFSGWHHIWIDGISHKLHPSCDPGAYHWRSDFFHSGMAA